MANGLFGGGDGTKEKPYLVEDAWDLNAVRNNRFASYKQTKDIDLSVFENFTPICDSYFSGEHFEGSYDGSSKKIKNLTILAHEFEYENRYLYVGLFGGVVGATLKNIIFENVDIRNTLFVGALCGSVEDQWNNSHNADQQIKTVIENCHVKTGNLWCGGIGRDSEFGGYYVGGLIGIVQTWFGRTNTIEISKCSVVDVTVKGAVSIGGFIGMVDLRGYGTVKITNCYAQAEIGQIDADTYYGMGGFIGEPYCYDTVNFIVQNCYTASTLTYYDSSGDWQDNYEETAGGFFGGDTSDREWFRDTEIFKIESNYYDSDLSGFTHTETAQPKTTVEMKRKETFVDWDFKNIWGIDENETYPFFGGQPRIKCKSFNLTD